MNANDRRPNLRPIVIWHYVWFLTSLLGIHAVFWSYFEHKDTSPDPAGSPMQKEAFYSEANDQFDLIFIGDSRTYCDLHPHQIDPLAGTQSLNMATFAHWFPTQYPAFQQLVPRLRKGTVVVWSIGLGNFHPAGNDQIQTTYPVGIRNIPQYLSWGYSWEELEPNVIYFATRNWLNRVRDKIRSIQSRSAWVANSAGNSPPQAIDATSSWQSLKSQLDREPWVASVEVLRTPETQEVTSLAAVSTRGAYSRYEIDSAYFRAQQQAIAHENLALPRQNSLEIIANSSYMRTFLAILDLFRDHQIDLIVNEVPEAPFVYASSPTASAYRKFLRGPVKQLVEEHGFTWISADVSQIGNADFFDYNHLNSQGVAKYSTIMGKILSECLEE